ncbi:MAG: aldo/keto reductase [Treponema sp.]|jgi:predicted aldo/keto reductase-like oxidoreductase|nr:aldo/keto reductase [Treponema sp.]
MQFRTDKKSGGKLSILGMGCMRFPRNLGVTDTKEAERLILGAIERGVNYFDTAYIYPGSEEVLGAVLAKAGARGKVSIATKLPLVLCRSGADFDKFFDKELERLQTDYVDYYLMHMLTDMALWDKFRSWGIEDWLAEKKRRGQIRQAGFSFHGQRDEFLRLLDAYPWELCQIQYNYSDENYQAGVTGLKKAAQMGLPVVVMEPLLGGKLAGGLPPDAAALFKQANQALSPAGWALRWLWNQSEVTVVLSGMNALGQLEENAALAESSVPGMLTDAEHAVYREVLEVFNKSYKIHCTGCNYCMPCPKNVNIPGCFAAYNTSYSIGFVAGMQQYMTSSVPTSDNTGRAVQCVECGKCEKHCPQHIAIRRELKAVRRRLEPWWLRLGIGAARAFLGRKMLP